MADLDELLVSFKEEFSKDYSSGEEQREAANRDMRFVMADDGQWEGWLADEAEDSSRLTIDMTTDRVDRFLGHWSMNKVGVSFEPDEGEASEEDAELLSKLWLKDFRKGDGNVSVKNAVFEGSVCGYGAWHLATAPVDEEDPDSLLRVVHKPLHAAHSTVVWDAGAQRNDKADAKRCSLLRPFTRKGFEEAYPDVETPVSIPPDDRSEFNWATKDLVYVVKRYHIERRKVVVWVMGNAATGQIVHVDEDDLEDVIDEMEASGFESMRSVEIMRRECFRSVYHGNGFLDKPERIAGRNIPVVPIYGKRTYVDGNEFYMGLVRKMIDPQRLYNLQVSQIADDSRDTNRRVPIFDPEQIDGLQAQFGQDLRDLPYIQARAVRDVAGNPVHLGPVGYLEPPSVDANTAALIEVTSNVLVQKSGGSYMEENNPDASGEAQREARKTVDISTAVYTDGIQEALIRAGDIYRDIAREVYASRRRVKLLGEDGSSSFVTLMDHVMDEERGVMVPVNDVTKGNFEVVVDTGPQYESAREATVENLKEILTNLAQGNVFEAPVLATLMANLPGVGIEELREFARKLMLQQGLRQPETDEEKAEVAAMQQEQDGGQAQLIEAVTMQAQSEAEHNRAQTIKDLSTADLNRAKASEINAKVIDINEGMKDRRMKLLMDAFNPRVGGAATSP